MSDPASRWAIGVGANLGDRARAHDEAARLLGEDGLVRIVARSRLRETAPVGGPSGQPAFLNAAWVVESGLGAHQLLHRLQGIEARLGRARIVRDGPRTIDLDLLLREDGLIVESAVLTLPHPRMHERAFVLGPLGEIAGAWRHPRLGVTVAELRALLHASRQ